MNVKDYLLMSSVQHGYNSSALRFCDTWNYVFLVPHNFSPAQVEELKNAAKKYVTANGFNISLMGEKVLPSVMSDKPCAIMIETNNANN